ncbi:hypothetical protein M758_UG062000 [Ceratodon purpureus]|nr:hypothetical protein M758_UG062000 [Ceratodon purpureus]
METRYKDREQKRCIILQGGEGGWQGEGGSRISSFKPNSQENLQASPSPTPLILPTASHLDRRYGFNVPDSSKQYPSRYSTILNLRSVLGSIWRDG